MDIPKAKSARVVLERIFKEHEAEFKALGVTVRTGNASVGSVETTMKLMITDLASNGEKVNVYAENLKKYYSMYGLEESDINFKYKQGGREYILTGINMKARNKPLIIQRVGDGQEFIISVDSYKAARNYSKLMNK